MTVLWPSSSLIWRGRPHPDRPDLVYHYTDTSGLEGILTSGAFHATHIRHMNDSEETQLAFRHASELITWLIGQGQLDDLKAQAEHAVESFSHWLQVNYCVISFSEAPDALSQWRGYGGPAQGYALGLQREALSAVGSAWRFERCVYDEAAAELIIRGLLTEAIEATRAGKFDKYQEYERLFRAIYSPLLLFSPFVKSAAFAEEREWRLVGGPLPGGPDGVMRTKVGRRGLVPYTNLPIPEVDGRLCVDEIWIGPGATKTTEHGLDSLLAMREATRHVHKWTSKAPYLP